MKKIKTQFDLTNHIMMYLNHEKFPQNEKTLLLYISLHVNPKHDWLAWPSAEQLMRLSGMSRSSVFRSLTTLKETGVVEYEKGKVKVANKYFISLDALNHFTEQEAQYVTGVTRRKPLDTSPKKEHTPPKPSSIVHKSNVSLEDFEEQCPF